MEKQKELLRHLPKVDECLLWIAEKDEAEAPLRIVKEVVQAVVQEKRQAILNGEINSLPDGQEQWLDLFQTGIRQKMRYNYRRVINGTGVVIHTNLGRSLLPEQASKQLLAGSEYYSNLEFDLATGKRGSRYSLVERLLCELTGAEAALVVNNNAAAVLLVLDTLAKKREVIVSRGQLVEIGGSFRIPEVMEKSGAHLVEVGATNRTHYRDYQAAITAETAMLLRVHTSNFRVIGFTADVAPEELVQLATEHALYTMEDLGSGSFIDLSQYGLKQEPTVQEAVNSGMDVVTFSGDKLLGGPQAGIIVGKEAVIAKVKKNPLNRALRIDKFTLAALEAILRLYYDPRQAVAEIPTLAMLTADPAQIKKRAQRIARRLKPRLATTCRCSVIPTASKVGGGAMPDCLLGSWAVALQPATLSPSKLEEALRSLELPVIGRIENEHFLLDARTIQEREINELCAQIVQALA